jgi:Zn-dependent metalloprotease
MRRALTVLGVLSLLTTGLAEGPAAAQKKAQQAVRIVQGDDTDAPAFVTGLDEPALEGRPAELALAHLSTNRSLYEIDAPAADLEVISVERSDDYSTVRFQQVHNGVEVFGAHYLVHFDERGAGREVTAVNGDFFTDLNSSVEARISEGSARKIALARLRGVTIEGVDSHGLVVLPDGGGVSAFHFTLWGHGLKGPVKQQVFISAHTGAQVLSYNDLHNADPVTGSGVRVVLGDEVPLSLFEDDDGDFEMRGFLDPNPDPPPNPPADPVEINTHDAKGKDGLDFVPRPRNVVKHDMDHFDGEFTDIGAVDAHWGAEQVFEFYKSLGRNSIDGDGKDIVSVVNATAGGSPMYNAFWDGTKMVYGNPEPADEPDSEVYPFSADLDIVAHELTHGVIDHSADLVYLNQSGAMNEAYADYFGNAVDVTISGTSMDDPEAGFIAEDLCRVPEPANWDCPLRDLNDGRDVEDYSFYLVDYDNGGVHDNSTIFSGALWDIREQLEPDFADQIMYRALTITPPVADFADGRNAIHLAAEQLSATPEQLDVIDAAFDRKQIMEGWDDSPGQSDSKSLLEDVTPLGFYNAAPQVSGSRYVVGTYGDKELMFEEPQDIVVGNVSGTGFPVKVNNDGEPKVLYDELPDISGEQVVWARGLDAGGGDVTFDVVRAKLGGDVRTITATPAFEWFPSIDGNLVAWERFSGGATDIWARRIGRLPKRITSGGGDELFPQVSETKVAWWDNRADRIGIKDFKTGKKTIIKHSNPGAFLGPPALNDTHVFWFQDANNDGTGAIMRAKHNGKGKKALVKESSEIAPVYDGIALEPPRISANNSYLVYVDEYGFTVPDYDSEHVGRDVWHLPVTAGSPRLVTCNRGDQAYASIGNGQRAVWLDGSLGRTDLMTRAKPRTTCRRTPTRG